MIKIFTTDFQNPWEYTYLQDQLGSDYVLEQVHDLSKPDLSAAKAEVLCVFVMDSLQAEAIKKYPNLKLITTRSTGFDHIDSSYAKTAGITVCNVPAYGDNTVAEHTFALILSLSRNLRKAYQQVLKGDYSLEGLLGFDLKNKTIGIVGTGKIGLRVIQIARGFSMNVLAYDSYPNTFMADVLGYRYVSFPELLSQADVISLHAPYSQATRHLINKNNINLIKRQPLLINTARGGLIETEALIKALDTGIISGAGLDVIECEELLLNAEDFRLAKACDCGKHAQLIQAMNILKRENVIFTPHMAFNSKEAVQRILDTTVENIRSFFSGDPKNVVS